MINSLNLIHLQQKQLSRGMLYYGVKTFMVPRWWMTRWSSDFNPIAPPEGLVWNFSTTIQWIFMRFCSDIDPNNVDLKMNWYYFDNPLYVFNLRHDQVRTNDQPQLWVMLSANRQRLVCLCAKLGWWTWYRLEVNFTFSGLINTGLTHQLICTL